jgi:hypothetical protein
MRVKADRLKPRDWPALYRAMMDTPGARGKIDDLRPSNPYKRPSLRAAFDCGWLAPHYIPRERLTEAFSSMSRYGLCAVIRGYDARLAANAPEESSE